MECTDDISCLLEQGASRYANTYVDRQIGQPIVALGLRDMTGRTFYGSTPSTDDINTFRPLNLVIAIRM